MKYLVLSACSVVLLACSQPTENPTTGSTIEEVAGPSPQATATPAEAALQCVKRNFPSGKDLRIGIGEIVDGTGARTFADGQSPLLTQRPDMMFAVAVMKTGARAINRNSTKISEWELAQSMEQRLGEGRTSMVEGQQFPYRPVVAGSMLGTTHYVTGALTEVNWNIYSNDNRGGLAGAFVSNREYYISVAVDLMVTETTTTEVVLANSFTKQVVGREISKGLFRFFEVDGSGQFGPIELFDASSGEQQNEPVQRAVRWLIDTATYDIVATLSATKEKCDEELVITRSDMATSVSAQKQGAAEITAREDPNIKADARTKSDPTEPAISNDAANASGLSQPKLSETVKTEPGGNAEVSTSQSTAVQPESNPHEVSKVSVTALDDVSAEDRIEQEAVSDTNEIEGTVMVGSFVMEASAKKAASLLAGVGLEPVIGSQTVGNTVFWYVKASSVRNDRALKNIQSLGFPDAYFRD